MFNFVSRRADKYFIAWEYVCPISNKLIKDSEIIELFTEKVNTVAIREWISYSSMAIMGEEIPPSSIQITAMSKL